MMRYFKFHGGNGYCGCDFTDYVAFEDDEVDEDLLNEYDEEFARNNAESFSHVATGWCEDWEDEQEEEDYYANAWCVHEEITEEEYNKEAR